MSNNDEWEYIPGFCNIFMINRAGSVRSIPKTNISCGRKRGNTLAAKVGRGGYIYVALRKDGKQRSYSIHRLLALTFIPNPHNKPCINHINSIRTDNSLSNLEWVTYSENNSHAHKYGNQQKYYGENHPGSKLTWKSVLEIRSKYSFHKYTMPMLALEYNVSKGAISAILSNKTWIHEHSTKY